MSNDKRRLLNGALEYEAPAPNATVETIRASIDERVTTFERHKKKLFDSLRDAYGRCPQSEPFDADTTWRHLTSLASQYFHREWVKQRATRSADRQVQLRELAKTLKRASDSISEAIQSDIEGDLISAWLDTPTPASTLFRNDSEDFEFVDLYIFEKTSALLGTLEAVALRAAANVPTKLGRPKGTATLPSDFIGCLASIYQASTQSKVGWGDGPFARFVFEFLTAVGRRIDYESVVGCVKDANISGGMTAKPDSDKCLSGIEDPEVLK